MQRWRPKGCHKVCTYLLISVIWTCPRQNADPLTASETIIFVPVRSTIDTSNDSSVPCQRLPWRQTQPTNLTMRGLWKIIADICEIPECIYIYLIPKKLSCNVCEKHLDCFVSTGINNDHMLVKYVLTPGTQKPSHNVALRLISTALALVVSCEKIGSWKSVSWRRASENRRAS